MSLRRVSRYKQYTINASAYLAGSLITSLLSVIVNPFLAKNLSPEDYAVIAYYTSMATLFSPLIGFYITDFFLRKYYVLSKGELFNLKGNIIKVFLLLSGLISVLSLLGILIFVKATHVLFPFFPYAVLAIFNTYISLLYTLRLAEYKIVGDSKNYFYASVFWGTIQVGLSLLFVVVIKGGAVGRMGALAIGSFLPFVWCLSKERRYLSVKIDWKVVSQIANYGAPLVVAGILGFFSNGFDKVVLEKKGDISAMGFYAVACQMSGYLNIFASAMKSTFQPDMYKAIAEKNIKRVTQTAFIVIGCVSAIVVVFIIFCPWLIKILTAGRYVASTGMSRILSLSVITSTLYFQIAQFTYGSGFSQITLFNKIIGTIFTIATFILMINAFGTIGASWATVISYLYFAVGNIILLYLNRRRLFAHEK